MELIEHINYLINASHKAKIEDLKIQEKIGLDPEMGIDLFDSKAAKYCFEERPERTKIEKYLEKLNNDVLLKLETLMYFGRDNDDFDNVGEYLSSLNELKEDIIRTIVEKRSDYPVYFLRAIEKLKAQGVDFKTL